LCQRRRFDVERSKAPTCKLDFFKVYLFLYLSKLNNNIITTLNDGFD